MNKKLVLAFAVVLMLMVAACGANGFNEPTKTPATNPTLVPTTQPTAVSGNNQAVGGGQGGGNVVPTQESVTGPEGFFGSCGRGPVGSATYEDINVRPNAPCKMMDADAWVTLMTNRPAGSPDSPFWQIAQNDNLVNYQGELLAAYQMRSGNSVLLGAFANQRVLWVNVEYVQDYKTRLTKLACNANGSGGTCLVVVNDSDLITVSGDGRGLLLSRPLTSQEIASIQAAANQVEPATTVEAQTLGQGGGACIESSLVISVINANKGKSSMYTELAKLAKANSAAVTVNAGQLYVVNGMTIIITKDGSFTSPNLQALDQVNNAGALYSARADGIVEFTIPYTALSVCEVIDPARDYTWWGR